MSRAKTRREVQAEETQRIILQAALKLFTEKGYGATSIADIAGEAGVAVPTVYTSIGTKPELLRRLLDHMDESIDLATLGRRVAMSANSIEALTNGIAIPRQFAEQFGDVIIALASAASVEPEMAAIYAGGMERHRQGARQIAGKLAELDALKPGMSLEQSGAIIATMTMYAAWIELTRTFGWSFDQVQRWIVETLAATILAED